MLPLEHPDHIQIAFNGHRLVNNAGLLLPATLVQRVGLRKLVDHYLDLGDAPGRANPGDKLMTLVASALAGETALTTPMRCVRGGPPRLLGCMVKAPSTLGTCLRSFRWGHVRQLDRVSRKLLARAWAAGGGPGDGPLIIDLDCQWHLGTAPNPPGPGCQGGSLGNSHAKVCCIVIPAHAFKLDWT